MSGKGGQIMNGVGQAADLIGGFMPEKTEYSGLKGDVAKGVDSAYDTLSNAVGSIPVYG
jgi:hypothetical protein